MAESCTDHNLDGLVGAGFCALFLPWGRYPGMGEMGTKIGMSAGTACIFTTPCATRVCRRGSPGLCDAVKTRAGGGNREHRL